jgi:endoglucanase
MKLAIFGLLFAVQAVLLSGCGSNSEGASVSSQPSASTPTLTIESFPRMASGNAPGASQRATEAAQRLNRGINFGNMLESPLEGDWGLKAEDRFIDLVGTGGFTSAVRLPVRWSNHASKDAAATIDPAFFARVDAVVDRLLARGATVLLNMHHYRQLDGDTLDPNEFQVEPQVVQVRMLSMWKQIAARYANRNDRLIFELYNEPHGAQENSWNDLMLRAFRVVRDSNPERVVMIGPTTWNNWTKLKDLQIPTDANLILTIHHYEPFKFTHQGAEWVSPALPTGLACCDEAQTAEVARAIDEASTFSARVRYPIVIGEFGAYSKAPQESRVRYSRLVRQLSEAKRIPWMYWELASGFGVYDPSTNQFRSDLFNALYGQ